ncbi:MAG: hypothetical protein C4523_02060 [Myxococcales bacterium]|nr:MAG: hypothetical protein C4523_02060 [Myxococcales bacterium]
MNNVRANFSGSGKPRKRIATRLQSVRLRKMLENGRAIIDLIGDGKEKQLGDYIFDRRYIVSLVERILEKSGVMVFDASVLDAEGNLVLYTLLDHCRDLAENLLADEESDGRPTTGGEAFEDTSEYRLLSRVLMWAADPEAEISIMRLIKLAFDSVFRRLVFDLPACRGSHRLTVNSNELEMIDLGGGMPTRREGIVTMKDIACRPLGILLEGAVGAGSRKENTKSVGASCFAAVNDDHLSFIRRDDTPLFIEATLMNHTASDFIFLYTTSPRGFDDLPATFRIEKTPSGSMAWSYGATAETLADNLSRIGRLFF